MAVKAGQLRHRIVIEQDDAQRDSQTNEPIENWKPFKHLWARIDSASGSERFASQQIEGTVTHQITIRNARGITNKMRVRYDARVFGILAALDMEERGAEGTLLCEERTNA